MKRNVFLQQAELLTGRLFLNKSVFAAAGFISHCLALAKHNFTGKSVKAAVVQIKRQRVGLAFRKPFHGDTTSGFMNATNINNRNPYLPQVSSYDYNSPLHKAGDTYLDMSGFGKGFVFLNGRTLSKYWQVGSQQTISISAV